jgi:hypothetical protein
MQHEVKYGERVLDDGTKEPSNALGCVKCTENDKTYLVAIQGQKIRKGR